MLPLNKGFSFGAFVSLVLLFVVGCKTPTYMPSTPYTGLMTQKGEIQLSGHMGTHGLQGHGVYAFTDYLLAGASFMYYRAVENSNTNNEIEQTQNLVSAMLGGYLASEGIFRASLMAGGGLGRSDKEQSYTSAHKTAFLQTNMGITTKFVDAGGAVRYTYAEYDGEYNDGQGFYYNGTFLEPYFFLRLGYRPVKLEAMIGMPMIANRDNDLVTTPVHFSLGVQFVYGSVRESGGLAD